MGLLADVEQRIDALFRRIFPRRAGDRVQPLEIAREMAKAMEEQRAISVDAVYVPNVFRAYVHADDFAALRPVLNTVKRDAAAYLERVAEKRGYSFTGGIRVEIAQGGAASPGRVVVDADFEEDEAPGIHDTLADSPHDEGDRGSGRTGDGGVDGKSGGKGDEDGATRLFHAPIAANGSGRTGVKAGVSPARLEVVAGPEAGRRLDLVEDRPYLIGRAPGVDLALSDSRVSKRHAELRFKDGAWWLTDLDSTNGTRRNGKPVASAPLADGDQVTVGLTTLSFSWERERTRIALERP